MKSTDILSPKQSLTTLHAIKRMSGPVVLVGDSYGGAVITAAGSEDANVKALVYIAAMAPDEGETVGQLLHRAAPHASAPALVPDEDGFLWMSADGFAKAVAPESPAGDTAVMAATQKPIAVSCLAEKMTKPAWREKPSWFLVAERDRMIAPDTQRYMAHRTGGHVIPIEVDHTPLASPASPVGRDTVAISISSVSTPFCLATSCVMRRLTFKLIRPWRVVPRITGMNRERLPSINSLVDHLFATTRCSKTSDIGANTVLGSQRATGRIP